MRMWADIGRSGAVALLAGAALGVPALGCGADRHARIDPRILVAQPPRPTTQADADERAGARYLERLAEHLERDPCAVRAMVAQRTTLYGERREAQIAHIDQMARRLCDDAVEGVRVRFDSAGELGLAADGGRAVGAHAVYVLEESFEPVSLSRRLERPDDAIQVMASVTSAGNCSGTVGLQPDFVVHVETDGDVSARLRGEGEFSVIVQPRAGVRTCASGDGEVVVPLGGAAAQYELYVIASASGPEVTLEVLPEQLFGPGAAMAWRPGTPRQVPARIGGAHRPASLFDPYCPGHLPEQPTAELMVQGSGFGEVWLESASGDPVLLVVGPNGDVYCNDDYNGLNPLLAISFYEGLWQIYAGSYAPGGSIDATLRLQ